MVGPPDEGEPPTSTRAILNRLRAVETLAQDLQRRVRDLEQANDEAAGEWPGAKSIREENRRKEEAAPGGRTEPRRDVLGAPHSEQ
jgi:hypothetical protein